MGQRLRRFGYRRVELREDCLLGLTVQPFKCGGFMYLCEAIADSEEERLVYETRMRALLDVESKIASAEEKGLAQGLEKGRAEGIAEGIAKGMEQGMAESLLLLLEERFGPLPEEVCAQVRAASAERLRQWMSRVFTAAALEELFAD